MSYIKRFFEIMGELRAEDRYYTKFTTDQSIEIARICMEEENKDRRTKEMNSHPKKPTENQINFLKKYGYANLDTLTKQTASDKINEIIERERVKK